MREYDVTTDYIMKVISSDKTISQARFDRWMIGEIRKAKAEAWEEGHGEPESCCGLCPRNACPWDNGGNGPKNPYTEES